MRRLGFLILLLVSFWARARDFRVLYPYFYYQDETRQAEVSLRLLREQTLETDFYLYPHFTIYLTSLSYAGYFLVKDFKQVMESRSLQPIVESAKEFDPQSWTALAIERGLTLVMGMMAVIAFFFLAQRLLGPGLGLFSALVYSLSPLPVSFSHLAKVDMFMACFALWSWLFQLRIIQEGKTRDYVLAGIFSALAYDSKINFALALSFLGTILLRASQEGITKTKELLDRRILLGIFALILTLFLASPYYFLNLDQSLEMIAWLYHASQWVPYFHIAHQHWWWDRFYYALVVLLPSLVSMPVWLLALIGIFYSVVKTDFREWYLVMGNVCLFLYIFCAQSGSYLYYLFLYVLPLIVLHCGLVFLLCLRYQKSWVKAGAFFGMVLILALSFYRARAYDQMNFRAFELAGSYLKEELQPGTKLLSFTVHLPGPALSQLEVKQVWPQELSQSLIKKENPNYILVDHWNFAGFGKYYENQLPIAEAFRELVNGEWGYRRVRSFTVNYPGAWFYQWLDPEFLVKLDLLKREEE